MIVRHGEYNLLFPRGQLDCQGLNRSLALTQLLNTRYGAPTAIYAANPNVTMPDSSSDKTCYPYVRPLATIEPTAVYFNLPVLTDYGAGHYGGPSAPGDYTVPSASDVPPVWLLTLPQPPSPAGICSSGLSTGDIDIAREILNTEAYCGKTVFIAWEHKNIPIIAYSFYYLLGLNPTNKIPLWPFGECLPSYAAQGYCTAGTWNCTYNFDTIYNIQINQTSVPAAITITLSNEDLNGQSISCPT